jgi:hypothetical protein
LSCHLGKSASEVFIEILRTWAGNETGPLSCNAYSRARVRNPNWPNRNTLARAFGSWALALDAAGVQRDPAI